MQAVMNLGSIISNAARRYPDRIGLVQGAASWSWSDLDRNVDAMAHALVGLGIEKGNRVMVQCPNSRYLFERHCHVNESELSKIQEMKIYEISERKSPAPM